MSLKYVDNFINDFSHFTKLYHNMTEGDSCYAVSLVKLISDDYESTAASA